MNFTARLSVFYLCLISGNGADDDGMADEYLVEKSTG